MTENTFPVYKVDAIVNFYRTEVLTGQEAKHFTKSDLTPTPKPESVQRLYMRILHLLYRFRPECHSMVPLMENIQYPAFHEWPTAIMSVYLYNINLSKKTIVILSGIMNFLHFRKQRMEMTLEQQARFRSDMDNFQTYTKGIKEAEKKIEMLTTIPPEQQAEAKELAAAISELQAATAHQYQEAVAKIAEKTQKLAQLKVDVSTLKEDISKLKSQIVESPEELTSQMEKMRENVKNIKSSIERADEYIVELQNTMQSVSQGEAEIQLMHNLLLELQTGMNNTKQRQEEVQELAAVYEKKQKEMKNLGTEENQLRRALGMKLDKESKQQIRRQKKKDMKDQHVQDVLRQCDQVHHKREEMADQIQEISRETQQLKANMQSLRDVCSKETKNAQDLYDSVLSSLDELHKRIEMHIVDLNQDISKMSANF
uniref:UF2 component of NDC80 kinetochore complex n=1 Tax=Myripristis murdjan TaxID=586833 RepID=A0A668A1D9_9TELE